MTRDEFINACVQSGYCNRKVASMYSQGKEDFTEKDFIEVYRLKERALDLSRDNGKYVQRIGFKSTKRYKQCEVMGSPNN